jgi:hypothetical protein
MKFSIILYILTRRDCFRQCPALYHAEIKIGRLSTVKSLILLILPSVAALLHGVRRGFLVVMKSILL